MPTAPGRSTVIKTASLLADHLEAQKPGTDLKRYELAVKLLGRFERVIQEELKKSQLTMGWDGVKGGSGSGEGAPLNPLAGDRVAASTFVEVPNVLLHSFLHSFEKILNLNVFLVLFAPGSG